MTDKRLDKIAEIVRKSSLSDKEFRDKVSEIFSFDGDVCSVAEHTKEIRLIGNFHDRGTYLRLLNRAKVNEVVIEGYVNGVFISQYRVISIQDAINFAG